MNALWKLFAALQISDTSSFEVLFLLENKQNTKPVSIL